MSRGSNAAMQVQEIPLGSTASYLEFQFRESGSPVDLSSATGSIYFNAIDVDGNVIASDKSAAFSTDGTDGKVRTQMNSALADTRRDLYVDFEVQGYGGGNLVGELFILRIMPRAKAV